MYKDKFISLIMGNGDFRPYGTPNCFELASEDFALNFGSTVCRFGEDTITLDGKSYGYTCAKCDDNTYLVGFDKGAIFLDKATGCAALYVDGKLQLCGLSESEASAAKLAGCTARLNFAQGVAVVCKFGEKDIKFDGGSIAVESGKLGEDVYFVGADTEDGCVALLFNTARFQFCGYLAGEKDALGGYLSTVQ